MPRFKSSLSIINYGLQVTNVCQSGFISCSKGTIWWGMLTMVGCGGAVPGGGQEVGTREALCNRLLDFALNLKIL